MQLVFPSFLWALVAVVIPVVVHLLQLRRPQRVLFTNTGFIREIEFKNGKRRLQDLLVLGLRVLAVVFLVLAFCQPFLPVGKGSNDGQEVQVAVDNSASMQQPGQQQQRLSEQGALVAQEIADTYGPDARLHLIGQPGRTATKTAFGQAVAALPTSQKRIGWGGSVVRQALQTNAMGAVYVVSDFQKSELPVADLRRLAATREIVLAPQVGRAAGNVYVDSVWLNDAFVRAGASVSLHIRLRNGGDEVVRQCPVKVLLGGRQVAAYQATVAAGQVAETVVQVQVAGQSIVTGQVQLTDAPIMFDNTYCFVLRPATAIQVVEIGPVSLTGAAYREEPLFRYSYMLPRQVDFGRLRQANLVLLSEAATVDASLREALVSVLRRGGSVVVVPAAPAATHEPATQLLRELGAGEAQWEASQVGGPVRQEIAMPDGRTPFFKEVFGQQPRQAAMPSASPVLRLMGGIDILRLRDGEGFLTEFDRGAGRAYVFSSPFSSAYSDFAAHALFVPVLYRLAMLSYRDDQPLAYRIGQGAVNLRVPESGGRPADAAPYRLVRDSLVLVPAQRQQGQQLRLEIPPELAEAGFYQLQRQGKTIATLAFDAPKAESELAAYSVAELRQLTSNRPNVRVLDIGEQPTALRDYRAGQTSRPLWRYCLLLALACLLAEGVVLRWGRRVPLPAAAR